MSSRTTATTPSGSFAGLMRKLQFFGVAHLGMCLLAAPFDTVALLRGLDAANANVTVAGLAQQRGGMLQLMLSGFTVRLAFWGVSLLDADKFVGFTQLALLTNCTARNITIKPAFLEIWRRFGFRGFITTKVPLVTIGDLLIHFGVMAGIQHVLPGEAENIKKRPLPLRLLFVGCTRAAIGLMLFPLLAAANRTLLVRPEGSPPPAPPASIFTGALYFAAACFLRGIVEPRATHLVWPV